MTHKGERGPAGFDADVADFLETVFPDREITYQLHLPQSGRFVDFCVSIQTPEPIADIHVIVETEDSFDGMLESVGQLLMYAGHFIHPVPVLAYPEGHIEEPEFGFLAQSRASAPVMFLAVPQEADSE